MSRTFDELITTAMLDLSRDATAPDDLAEVALAGARRRHRVIVVAGVITAAISLGTGALAAISANSAAPGPRPGSGVSTSTPGPGESPGQSLCPSPAQEIAGSEQPCLGEAAGRTLPAPSTSASPSSASPEPVNSEPAPTTKPGRPRPSHSKPNQR